MPQQRQPLFLARASYRKRRLRDGARMLPVFGAVLFFLPLLWAQSSTQIVVHWFFLFGVWIALIVVTAVISRGLIDPEAVTRDADATQPARTPNAHPSTASPPPANIDGR